MSQYILNDTIQAVQEGALPWQAVIEVQQASYPRCAAHGARTPMVLDDEPICCQCVTEPAIQLRLRALRWKP